MADAILTIEGLSLWAQGRPVLQDIGFSLPPTGITALMGPVGAGKSALVKWLCGKADPAFYTAEVRRAEYFLAPLARRNRPLLLAQRQGLGLRQMMQLLDVMLAANPPLICLDEPTFGLAPNDADRMMDRLTLIARSRAVLLVSHNQSEVQGHAQRVLLLAAGKTAEHTSADRFFHAAQTAAGRRFVDTGGDAVAGIDMPAPAFGPEFRPPPRDLGLRPVGCGGRLRAVLGDRVFVHDLPRSPGLPRTDAAAFAAAGLRVAATFAPLSKSESLALLAYGLTGLRLPGLRPDDPLPALRARCHLLQTALADQGALVFLRRPEDQQVGFAIALFLVSLGVRADLAADIGGEIDGLDQPDPVRETRIRDLDLALDLERGGADPGSFAHGRPGLTRSDRQTADPPR